MSKTRRHAIRVCAITASNSVSTRTAVEEIGASIDAHALALAAMWHCADEVDVTRMVLVASDAAEAECLLREGWVP